MQVDPIVPPSRFPAEYKRIADANFTVSLQQPVPYLSMGTCNLQHACDCLRCIGQAHSTR